MNRQSDRLPQGWKWVRLGDVCEVILGQSPPSSTYRKIPEGLPFFQGKADFGDISPNPTTWCVEPKKVAEPGDVLISMRAPVGPTNIANTRCCIGRGLAAIRCRNEADRDFVLAGLKLYESDISSMGTGSLFNAITGKQLKEFVFPLPPLPEQKRIAALLNQQMAYVEKARKAAEEMLEAAQALPGAFLRQVFPAHGDALPAGWKWTQLGDVLASIQPGFACGKRDEKGVAQLRMNNISTDGRFNWDKIVRIPPNYTNMFKYWLEPGDVLFNNTNSVELVGKSAIFLGFHEKVVYSNHFNRLRPDTNVLDTSYLANWLLYNWIHGLFARMCNRWVGQAAVPRSKLLALKIPLPPLCEQKRIAALLKEQMAYVETVRMSAREQLDAINALPAALLRRAFAGTL